jgi:hypothetical protein
MVGGLDKGACMHSYIYLSGLRRQGRGGGCGDRDLSEVGIGADEIGIGVGVDVEVLCLFHKCECQRQSSLPSSSKGSNTTKASPYVSADAELFANHHQPWQ